MNSWYRNVYLKSTDWKNLRFAVVNHPLFGKKCFRCRKRRKLDAHHIRYRKLYNVRPSDLVPLCRDCHEYIHRNKIKICSKILSTDTTKLGQFRNIQFKLWRILNIGNEERRTKAILGLRLLCPQFRNLLDNVLQMSK